MDIKALAIEHYEELGPSAADEVRKMAEALKAAGCDDEVYRDWLLVADEIERIKVN